MQPGKHHSFADCSSGSVHVSWDAIREVSQPLQGNFRSFKICIPVSIPVSRIAARQACQFHGMHAGDAFWVWPSQSRASGRNLQGSRAINSFMNLCIHLLQQFIAGGRENFKCVYKLSGEGPDNLYDRIHCHAIYIKAFKKYFIKIATQFITC